MYIQRAVQTQSDLGASGLARNVFVEPTLKTDLFGSQECLDPEACIDVQHDRMLSLYPRTYPQDSWDPHQ